jgi:hypothetical protein
MKPGESAASSVDVVVVVVVLVSKLDVVATVELASVVTSAALVEAGTLELGLLPRPTPRGVATVYSREQLLRLQAIALMRRRERLHLPVIKRRLSTMTIEQIEQLVTPPAPSPAPPVDPLADKGARWDRIELLPGLELNVRTDATTLVRRLASEILAGYGAAKS